MKSIFKCIVLLVFVFVSCSKNDDFNGGSYSYKTKIGNSANDILSNTIFTDLYVDVMYVEGAMPSQETLNNLDTFIKERTYKSNIIIATRLISIEKKELYAIDEVRSIEDANRLLFTQDQQIVVSALFLNGKSSNDEEGMVTLGTAHRNTSFVIFKEAISNSSSIFLGRQKNILETSVVLHEFCHLLGLVNIGSQMVTDHQDKENGYHCKNPACLMYYQEELHANYFNGLNEFEVPSLDADCIADLQANGGK